MNAARAWTDLDYRGSLSQEDLANLPTHPAGDVLDDADLTRVVGATSVPCQVTFTIFTTVTISLDVCSGGSVCGTCGIWSQGCC